MILRPRVPPQTAVGRKPPPTRAQSRAIGGGWIECQGRSPIDGRKLSSRRALSPVTARSQIRNCQRSATNLRPSSVRQMLCGGLPSAINQPRSTA
jgi:hypothetical protein